MEVTPLKMLKYIAILVFVTLTKASPSDIALENIQLVVDALEKNLQYIYDNPDECNADCVLGPTTAVGLLPKMSICSEVYNEQIAKVVDLAQMTYNKILPIVKDRMKGNETYTLFLDNLMQPYGIQDIKFHLPRLQHFPQNSYDELVTFKHQQWVFDSDFCLRNIIENTKDLQPKVCALNDSCINEGVRRLDYGSDYQRTHKLIFLQFAKRRNCLFPPGEYEAKVERLCSLMFWELLKLEKKNLLSIFADLLMEFVTLCGREGYTEFMNLKYLHVILETQHASGCFLDGDTIYQMKHVSKRTRVKRNSAVISHGCSDHTTGLGVDSLATFLKYLVASACQS